MSPTEDAVPGNSAPVPRRDTMSARAQQALLDLAKANDRQRSEDEVQAITKACKTAEDCIAHLRLTEATRRGLISLGVAVAEPRKPDTAKARKHLRSLATSIVNNPDAELADRLASKSLDDAWEVARRTARAAERILSEAADSERQRLRPDDLNELAAPASGSVAIAISRLRRTFEQQAKDIAVGQLTSAVERWRVSAQEWESIRKEVEEAMARLHPDVQAFLDAAISPSGASWLLVTDEVREWLDRDGNGDGYVMRRTHG